MALHIEVFLGAECTVVLIFIDMHSNIGKTKIACDIGSFGGLGFRKGILE